MADIDWQPAHRPFGLFSFVPPEHDTDDDDEVDGRRPCYGLLDRDGRPVWEDAHGGHWAGPWPAEARALTSEGR